MNYLKIDIEPVGCKRVHPQLEDAFISFMLLGGWIMRVNCETGLLTFLATDKNGKKKSFKLQSGCDLGEVALKSYYLFLRMYLKKGAGFIHELKLKLLDMKKVA